MPLHENFFLISYMKHQITGSKLPLKGDCLKVLFYNMRKIEWDILFFGFRHYMYDIILSTVFIVCKVSVMSGPDIPLFKKLKNSGITL